MKVEQALGGEAGTADATLELPLRPVLVEEVVLVAGAGALVLSVAVARGVDAPAVPALEAVGLRLVTVAVDMALQQGPSAAAQYTTFKAEKGLFIS